MKIEELKYIIRNISRNKKQTFFTILCIFISSFVILGNLSMNNGIQTKLKQGINQAISGQLTVYSTNDATINILESQLKDQNPFQWDGADTKAVEKISNDITINKRIRFGSLISFGDETSYTNVHALEQPHLQRMQTLITIKNGVMPIRNREILISETLADDLHCNVGDTLLLVADNINNYMSDDVAVVTGIFAEKGLSIFLNYTAFIPYMFGNEIVQIGNDECLELVLNSNNNLDFSDKTIAEIEDIIKSCNPTVLVVSWNKTIPLFYSIANIWKNTGYFIHVFFIIFSLMILTTLVSLIVYSRKKEFGTLLAIGFSWKKITFIICLEYLIISLVAILLSITVLGCLFLFIPGMGFYISSKDLQSALMAEYILPYFNIVDCLYIILIFSITMTLSVLLSIYRIKKLTPIELINN